MENSMKVPQKLKKRTTIWSSNSTSRFLTKENKKHKFEKIYAPQCSLQHYLQ